MPALVVSYGKGPVWQAFDRWFGRADLQLRLARKVEVLTGLHAAERFTDFAHAPSTWSAAQVDALKEHINADWFGLVSDGTGRWSPADVADRPPTAEGIGAWLGWRGDAESITRETVIRAIEVSLGVAHRDWNPAAPVTADDYGISATEAPRNWPIEFSVVSPAPAFAAALSWRHDAGDESRGLVSVVWFVPGDGRLVALPDESMPTDTAESRFGSWFITQAQIDPIPVATWTPTARGDWRSPIAALWSHGAVRTVAPTADAGGVDTNANY